MAQPLSIPRQAGDADNLAAIARFFELDPEGAEMARLTRLSTSSLGRLRRGSTDRPRPAASSHLAVLTAFASEAADFLERVTGPASSGRPGSMRDWLHGGWVRTSQGRMRPIDALSDPDLAVEALNELRRAAD